MFEYTVHFSTWRKQRGIRVRSTPFSIMAEDFAGVARIAASILSGMKNADPLNEYSIQSIAQRGCGGLEADPAGLGCFAVTVEEESLA